MTILFVLLVLVIIILIISTMRSRAPKHRGLFTMKCPHCRNRIPDRALVCEFCHRPTGRED